MSNPTLVDELTDEELTALALAADPDAPIDPDAPSLWELEADDRAELLPAWYMPASRGSGLRLRGWRRQLGWVVIAAFLFINAAGLCSTYGHVVVAGN